MLTYFIRTTRPFGNQSEGSPFTTAYREDAIIPVYDIMGNFAGTKSQGLVMPVILMLIYIVQKIIEGITGILQEMCMLNLIS
jgi:hypothetical protein